MTRQQVRGDMCAHRPRALAHSVNGRKCNTRLERLKELAHVGFKPPDLLLELGMVAKHSQS